MKRYVTSILLVLMFFIGLSVLLYPTIADYVNSRVQSRAIADYEAAIKNLTPADYSAYLEAAETYNKKISGITFPFMNYNRVSGYNEALNVNGDGIMGFVDIEKIRAELPIYHGTDDSVLARAAGHLKGSTLPIGGESTHCVISAHRGLPSAKLFTNLDKIVVGDTFTLTVLNRVLTYEVDQILIVEPQDVEPLYIVEGEDYCTLVTCTPYGINTHRLLVRGKRIETATPKPRLFVVSDGYLIDPIIVTPAVAAPMLFVLFIFLMIKYRKKKTDK
ncbi:MAG: class C sortase [Clostridiales bacterium]|nr:class C sortase [Clostridiales bacterium]